jgi:hypothetical protein
MSAASPESDLKSPTAAEQRGHPQPVEQKLTYQVILRHLAKFRDGAHHLLEIIGEHAASLGEIVEDTVPSAPAIEARTPPEPEPEPRSTLERRIERHMSAVDRALTQINKLNPEHRKKAELPPEVADQIVLKERTIHDIVAAELHFWAATIENSPLDRFDAIEQTWIHRIIRLARRIGVDADHKEHLDFLEDWASQEHS